MIDWTQVGVSAIITVGPIVGLMIKNRRKAKQEVTEKHDENKKLLENIITLQKYHPPHTHAERKGPLLAENIVFPPRS